MFYSKCGTKNVTKEWFMHKNFAFTVKFILFIILTAFLPVANLSGQSAPIRLRANVTNYTGFLFNHENRAANFSSVDLEWGIERIGRNELHTLKMTFNWRNGSRGSLTLYGGHGALGDAVFWYPHSYVGDFLIEGNFLWPTDSNGRPYSLPQAVWINGRRNGQVNSIVFIVTDSNGNPADVFFIIELDRSFFP